MVTFKKELDIGREQIGKPEKMGRGGKVIFWHHIGQMVDLLSQREKPREGEKKSSSS